MLDGNLDRPYCDPVPSRKRGVAQRHETWGGMRWTWMVLLTRALEADVQNRVVLTPRRWCQVRAKERGRRWPTSPEHRGEHEIAVKTIAWGMPGDSGVTCMLVCILPLPSHTRPRAHRAPGIPCALNSEGGNKCKPRGGYACGIAKPCPHGGLFEN